MVGSLTPLNSQTISVT